jgi:hypothetical protein
MAVNYEPATMPQLIEHFNANVMVVLQIETKRALEMRDELLDVQGIDAVMVGPADLSISLGVPGEFQHPTMVDAMEAIMGGSATHAQMAAFLTALRMKGETVDEITGAATEFDFGTEFAHGGYLVALVSWTVDSGDGIDDRLVIVGSQGDITIYQGTDPDDPAKFSKIGTWYVGPLPGGRRCVSQSGGDVLILTQFGLLPVSRLQSSAHVPVDVQAHISFLIDPLLARLMQLYAAYPYWSIASLPREELILIQLPDQIQSPGGNFLAYKTPTGAWSLLNGTRYTNIVSIDNQIYAGTNDGRVVQAFNGALDNVLLETPETGTPIICQVTPAYNPLGGPGQNKIISMFRPTFLATQTPKLSFKIMTDYNAFGIVASPVLPVIPQSYWDDDLWDTGIWSGFQSTIHEWVGSAGEGFTATVQMDYACGGDTVLMAIDFWTTKGNVL